MLTRVALLSVSLALPAPARAAPADPAAPPVQRPAGASGPPVQRPAELSSGTGTPAGGPSVELSSGTGTQASGLSSGTGAVNLSSGTGATGELSSGTGSENMSSGTGTAGGPRRAPARRPAGAEAGVYAAQPGVVAVSAGGLPRYFRAPFAESMWPSMMGREVLVVLGTGARECVTLTRKTPEALYFTHRKHGAQQAPLAAVTSIHEHSWECKRHDATPSEWARSGAGAGLALSGVGLVMGALYDVAHPDPKCEVTATADTRCAKGGLAVPHFMYTVIGVTTTTLGTPVVAIGGASTSRDLRVKGKIWARAAGWTFYSAATLLNILWVAGFYGRVEGLSARGMTTTAGVLGLGGSAFMAVDALMSRRELIELRRQDALPRPGAGRGLRFGAAPIGQAGQMSGLSFGVGGRF